MQEIYPDLTCQHECSAQNHECEIERPNPIMSLTLLAEGIGHL